MTREGVRCVVMVFECMVGRFSRLSSFHCATFPSVSYVGVIVGFSAVFLLLGLSDSKADAWLNCHSLPVAEQSNGIRNQEKGFGFQIQTGADGFNSRNQTIIEHAEFIIEADTIQQIQNGRVISAVGKVRVFSNEFQLQADAVTLNLDQDTLIATNPQFKLFGSVAGNGSVSYGSGRGVAELLTAQQQTVQMKSAELTYCPEGNDDLVISAEEITLDAETRQGIARNLTLQFKRRTILVLPYARFPVGSERLSGFLYPKLGVSGKRGTTIEVPYYFNLAPNQDATLIAAIYSKRGIQLQNEYRFLGVHSQLKLLSEYMPRDDRYQHREKRYGAELNGQWHDGEHLFASVDSSWVSDENYLDDYSGVFSQRNKDYLKRQVQFSYVDSGLNISTGVTQFLSSKPDTNTNNNVDDQRVPYDRKPWFTIDYRKPIAAHFALATSLAVDHFRHVERPAARRLRAQSGLNARLSNEYSVFDLNVGVEYLKYNLTEPTVKQSNRMSVKSRFVSADVMFYFDRYGGTALNRRWTLTPRIKWLAVDHPEQNNLPNFDSTLTQLDSYHQVFADSPYVGGDRLRESNQISVGLSLNYDDIFDAARAGSVGIGRIFYPNGHSSSLPDNDSQNSASATESQAVRDQSDLYLETRMTRNQTEFKYSALIAEETNKITSSTMRLTHALSARVQWTSLFRHRKNDSSQWGNVIRIKLNSNWLMNLQTIRAYDPDQLENTQLSFDYQSCCVRVALTLERERQSDSTYDNSIFLIFDLTPQF